LPAIALIAALCAGLAFQLQRTQTAGKAELRSRFALRADLTASFTQSFVGQLQARELSQAHRWLGGSLVLSTTFDEIAGSFGFDSAELLDDRGRAIALYPSDPTLIGADLTTRYPHLARADEGHRAVSPIVLSPSGQASIVESAVPFMTSSGRRVFSGGFDIGSSPVGAYLRSATSLPHSVVAINDGTGDFVTGASNGVSAASARIFEGTSSRAGYVVSEERVQGTPWSVDALVPSKDLYAPLRHRNLLYWLMLVAFAAACAAALGLLYRLMRSKDELRRLASVDPLTGAWNRRALEETYERRIALRARSGTSGAVLLLDLDGFKQVNDVLGHARGDDVLRGVVETLRTTLRASDIIARIGGDEFAVLLPDADLETAEHVAEKVAGALKDLAIIDSGHAISVHASIGIALESDEPATLADLLNAADAAMYREKARPRHDRRHADRAAQLDVRGSSAPSRPHELPPLPHRR
jgi:diguanylate cyclase (GGDEF)-like protein